MSILKMANFSKNLNDFITLFKFLSSIKEPGLKLRIVKHLSTDDKFNRAIREVAFNIVRRNIPLSDKDKKLLKPFEKIIFKLASASTPKKRKQVVQKGKGVILGSVLVPLAISLINELIN